MNLEQLATIVRSCVGALVHVREVGPLRNTTLEADHGTPYDIPQQSFDVRVNDKKYLVMIREIG